MSMSSVSALFLRWHIGVSWCTHCIAHTRLFPHACARLPVHLIFLCALAIAATTWSLQSCRQVARDQLRPACSGAAACRQARESGGALCIDRSGLGSHGVGRSNRVEIATLLVTVPPNGAACQWRHHIAKTTSLLFDSCHVNISVICGTCQVILKTHTDAEDVVCIPEAHK